MLMAIARARSVVEPLLTSPIAWHDVQPMLAEIDSPEDLQAALTDVGSFLDKAKDCSGALGAKMFLLSKKSLIQAMLPWPLKWEDMLPALYEVTELSDARELAADPEGFLARFTRPQEASKEQMKKKPCYEFGEPWACKILLLQARCKTIPSFPMHRSAVTETTRHGHRMTLQVCDRRKTSCSQSL